MEVLLTTYGIYLFLFVVLSAFAVSSYFDCLIAEVAITTIALAVLFFFFKVDFKELLAIPWYGYLISILSYFGLGILWSFFKFNNIYSKKIEKLKYEFDHTFKSTQEAGWSAYVDEKAPKVSNFKQSISSWVLYWPFSVIVYLGADLLVDLANKIYDICSEFYERIAARVIQRYKNKYK